MSIGMGYLLIDSYKHRLSERIIDFKNVCRDLIFSVAIFHKGHYYY